MNKIVVLYKSKYGAAKTYANWIKEELCCDVFEIEQYDWESADRYDCVVIAGGIYAGGISAVKALKKNAAALSGKKAALFAVGASPLDEKALEQIKEQNLKQLSLDLPLFYGRGVYDESKMNFKDRTLCTLLKKALRKKDPQTFDPWMKELLEFDGQSCDWTDPVYLKPLLDYIR